MSNQSDRYSRQSRFAPIGVQGQEKLEAASAAIIGCGALGTYHAAALARAGVGRLRIIDRDYVELNNLQRQWLFDESDAEQALPKAVAAARQIARINSGVRVEIETADLCATNAHDLLQGVDVLLDGTDNFETRYLINDYAVKNGVPWIYGAAVASYGITMAVLPGASACLACVYPEPPRGAQATCETDGVISSITSIVGALQVAMAMQILTGQLAAVPRRITTVDAWAGTFRQLDQPPPDPDCAVCAHLRFAYLDGQRRAPISLCGRNAVQIHERQRPIDLPGLAARLAPLGMVKSNEFALRFFVDAFEMTVFPDGRAIVKGTQDVGIARSLYARYIGA